MTEPTPPTSTPDHAFDEAYFHSGPYAHVSFKKYSQYWWSNRFYATLVLKHAPRPSRLWATRETKGFSPLSPELASPTPPPPSLSQTNAGEGGMSAPLSPPSLLGRERGRGEGNPEPSSVIRGEGKPRLLEIGCGLGHLLTWLVGRFAVYGSDINEWALQQARTYVPQGQFDLLSAEDLSLYPDRYFQVVVAKHVVEHLPHPERAIAEMSRILAPGGLLVLATPNLDSPMRIRKKENWIGYQDKTHISLKPPAEWLDLLRLHGLQPRKVFSDGFWDAPYLPLLPTRLQKLLFGLPGGLQAIFGWSIIPLKMGESLIVLAKRV